MDTKEAATAVREILPLLSGGRVLLTSRLSRWPPELKKQELETMIPKNAVRFLLQRTETEREPADDDPVQARRLAEVLGGLPLALEQAAAYIGTNRMRLVDYLAQLLQATNRLSDAEPLMRSALAIDEAVFGNGHPKIAIRLNNLAQLLKATNRLLEAEPLMRRAVEIFERSLGLAHPRTQTARRNLR